MGFEDELIAKVKAHPILYDVGLPEYKLAAKREANWRQISEELGISVERAKRKWKSLRDSFRTVMVKTVTPDGSLDFTNVRWGYFEQLLFLKDITGYMDAISHYCRKRELHQTATSKLVDEVSRHGEESGDFDEDVSQGSTRQYEEELEEGIFERKLIEKVRANPALYELGHPQYKNIFKKEYIWKKISKELNEPFEKVKRRWRSLRNSFRMVLQRCISSGVTNNQRWEDNVKWVYFKSLFFLSNNIGDPRTPSKIRKYDYYSLKSSEVAGNADTEENVSYENVEYTEFPATTDTCNSRPSKRILSIPSDVDDEETVNENKYEYSSVSPKRQKISKQNVLEISVNDPLYEGNCTDEYYRDTATTSVDLSSISRILKEENTSMFIFMKAMSRKIENAKLTPLQEDEMQEAILTTINSKLRELRN